MIAKVTLTVTGSAPIVAQRIRETRFGAPVSFVREELRNGHEFVTLRITADSRAQVDRVMEELKKHPDVTEGMWSPMHMANRKKGA